MRVVNFTGFLRLAHVLKGKCHCSANVTVLKTLCFVGCEPASRSVGWVLNSGTAEPEIYDRSLSKADPIVDKLCVKDVSQTNKIFLSSKISDETSNHPLIVIFTFLLQIIIRIVFCFRR